MSVYPLQAPAHGGSTLNFAAPGGTAGDTAPTGQGIGLMVNVASGTATVTLPIAPPYDGLAVASRNKACPPGVTLIPLPSSVYGQGTTAVTYSTVSGVTVAAVRIP